MQLSVSWSRLKTLKSNLNAGLYYWSDDSTYFLVTGNTLNQYYTKVSDTDKTEFETDFKNDAIEVSQLSEALSYLV